jgi:hypothetical protein
MPKKWIDTTYINYEVFMFPGIGFEIHDYFIFNASNDRIPSEVCMCLPNLTKQANIVLYLNL